MGVTANRCAVAGPLRCNAQAHDRGKSGEQPSDFSVSAPSRRQVAGFRYGRPGLQSSTPLSSWRSTRKRSSAEPPPLTSPLSWCWTPSRWRCGCAAGRNTRPGQAGSTAATQDRPTPSCRSPPPLIAGIDASIGIVGALDHPVVIPLDGIGLLTGVRSPLPRWRDRPLTCQEEG